MECRNVQPTTNERPGKASAVLGATPIHPHTVTVSAYPPSQSTGPRVLCVGSVGTLNPGASVQAWLGLRLVCSVVDELEDEHVLKYFR